MHFVEIVEKPSQYTLTFFGIASSDVSFEFMLLFFGLFFSSQALVAIGYLTDSLKFFVRKGPSMFTSTNLCILLSAQFIVALIFLSHHVFGFPDIHRSPQLVTGQMINIDFLKSSIIVWLIFILIEGFGHIVYKRTTKGSMIIALSILPLFLNLIVIASHRVLGFPTVIY